MGFKIAVAPIFPTRGGGRGNIKFALIGLGPYSFHWDLSKTSNGNFRVPQYLSAFNDLHNFWLPIEEYKKIFRSEYLNYKMPYDARGMNCVADVGNTLQHIERKIRINARKSVDLWKNKSYPETRKENIKIFDEYLTLCDKNNVRPIIFLPPLSDVYKKHFNRKIFEEFYYFIGEAQRKHRGAIFLDGWKLPGFSDDDFSDNGHLNIQGAAKFSTILNGVIENLEKG